MIGLYVNPKITEAMSFNQVNSIIFMIKATNGSEISSAEKNIKISERKRNFFSAVIEFILLYGSAAWTPTHAHEKMLDGTYTRMLRTALNIS